MSVGRIVLAALLVFCAHGTVAGSEGDGSFEAHESAWGGPGETALAAGWTRGRGAAVAETPRKFDFRRSEYEARCAGCHGPKGRGDGVNKPFLEHSPADLTALAKTHGGEFPYDAFYSVVEGRNAERRDMPCFATVYAEAARGDAMDVPYDEDRYMDTRLVALADYVAGLQVK
jgi:mono/diheme cytochrome c family protein